jgi:phosphatidylserine/phosphatidylglycerophosphate/cardiolipin synthase-like enzyme
VEAALVNLLDTAQDSILFLAYSFTSNPLGEAIQRADKAGVVVRGVMDEDQASSNIGTELTAFRSAGLDVRLDGNPGQMHEKVMIIDEEVVVVGSYNFSRNANEVNDENVLVIHSRALARQFVDEFNRLYNLAPP